MASLIDMLYGKPTPYDQFLTQSRQMGIAGAIRDAQNARMLQKQSAQDLAEQSTKDFLLGDKAKSLVEQAGFDSGLFNNSVEADPFTAQRMLIEQRLKMLAEDRKFKNDKSLLAQKLQAVGGSGYAKAPAGYRYRQDGQLEPIPGGPAEKIADAGRVSLAKTSLGYFPEIEKNFVDDFSLLDYQSNRGKMGRANNKLREAVGAAIYAKTGAAATPKEIDEQITLYAPGWLDTKQTRKEKLGQLKAFLTNFVETSSRGHVSPKDISEDDLSSLSNEQLIQMLESADGE